MKRFVKWIAIVLAICTLAVCLVACAPKAVDAAAKTAWVKCNRTMPLLNATNTHLDSVDYTAYKTLEGNKAYMFKFVCTYTQNGKTLTNKVFYYKVIADTNEASFVSFAESGKNSYDSWTKDKKVQSFSDKETAVVAEYYETNKEAIIAEEEARRLAEEEAKRLAEEGGEED